MDVLDLCNGARFMSSFVRFAEVTCRVNPEFLFAESEPSMFLPDAVLNKPMAPAADPLDSFAAALPSSLRASLSHQNSQARESEARPLKLRCKPDVLNDLDVDPELGAASASSMVWRGLGGDGDAASLVMISALPSAFIDRRTNEDAFLSWRSSLSGTGEALYDCADRLCRIGAVLLLSAR
jgi:hypothetical protein